MLIQIYHYCLVSNFVTSTWSNIHSQFMQGRSVSPMVMKSKAAKIVLDWAPHSFFPLKQFQIWNGWIYQPESKCNTVFLYLLINDSERNSTIIWGLDYHSHNSRSKETIRTIRSNTNRGLLRSFNSALKDYNSLPVEMRCLP